MLRSLKLCGIHKSAIVLNVVALLNLELSRRTAAAAFGKILAVETSPFVSTTSVAN